MINLLNTATAATPLSGTQIAQYILGGVLILLGIAIVILVLMQSGKEKGLSGTIAGNAETFFSKNGGKSSDKKLSTITIIASIVMVVLTLAMTILVSVG